MQFAKLDHESLKEAFVKQIQKMIFSGELKPGMQLPAERELAKQMGISRSLVNVGILELESQGFLRIEPRRGSFVCDYRREGNIGIFEALMHYDAEQIDPALFEAMIEARSLIESECARLASILATKEDFLQMEQQLMVMEQNKINDAFIDASVEFHHLLTLASQNAVYAILFRSIAPVVRHFSKIHYTGNSHREKTIALHRDLLAALRSGNAVAAAATAKTTLLLGEATLKKKFKQN